MRGRGTSGHKAGHIRPYSTLYPAKSAKPPIYAIYRVCQILKNYILTFQTPCDTMRVFGVLVYITSFLLPDIRNRNKAMEGL